MTKLSASYADRSHRPRWWLVVLIVLLHIAIFYGLALALAPDLTRKVERTVVSAFTVTVTTPDPPPPENESKPDEGAQGDPGSKAVPQPVAAPTSRIERSPTPLPRASSTGTDSSSGAQADGDGTGAAGSGPGTGSGNEGGGQGGIAVSKPVHISGAISNARDYPVPPGGREARRGTEVIVRVTVGVDGRARQCSIYRASPDPEADRITCRLVEERLRFRPAQDANGNPVPAPFY